ncbi:MBL fold metallo-hydrolase [uncultured Eudoraea sp.]|uniref:MBL fold metallo-hydrolase n=1 Tax=uncultured Eudoraea sp. TaxID=1035614 RepID=UPI00260A8892|nr:MBL fold metallo-hydrolase [uncultured Eudoraea sp.]
MKVKLHGTRGAYPTSSKETRKLGGNTPCIEIIGENERLILDAGTGILNIAFDKYNNSDRIDILLTHLHMDHIQGLGFFKPLFDPNKEIHIWGPGGSSYTLKDRLNRFLSPPLFPVMLRDIPSKLIIHELPNKPFKLGKFLITSKFVCHPGPTVGYRIEVGSKSVTYIPDHEPILSNPHLFKEDNWISGFDLCNNTDLLVHDSQYSPEEYEDKVGWGHCSMEIAAELSARANAKRLVMFHHDPAQTDKDRSNIFKKFMSTHTYDFPIELAVQGHEIEV